MTTKTKRFSLLNNETRKFALHYLEALDSPTSLGIAIALRYGDDVAACSHAVNPRTYLEAERFKPDYMSAQLLSKFEEASDADSLSRRVRSLEKFWECEDHLRLKNIGLKQILYGCSNHRLNRIFYAAREKMQSVLGPLSGETLDIRSFNFGPGSSSSVPARRAHNSTKFLSLDVNRSCYPLVRFFCQDIGIDLPVMVKPNFIDSSKIIVVPKNFKSDRIIAIEPDWNIFIQKGIGAAIRSRLLKAGIDLDHGAERHGSLSRIGSLSGELATVDLSSASDSISTELVKFLLPREWFNLLNSARTSSIRLSKKKTQPLLKFSSMGNGFTFELESLVFFCLAFACCTELGHGTRDLTVFGDDIIVKTDVVPLLNEVFAAAGFRFNTEKTFVCSYFRESCGEHYFRGQNVKPFFLRRNITNDNQRFAIANAVRRLSFRSFHYHFDSSPLYSAYCFIRRHIVRVFYIPDGVGDGGLIVPFDQVCPSVKRKADIYTRRMIFDGYHVRCLLPVQTTGKCRTYGLLISRLWTTFRKGNGIGRPDNEDRVYAYMARLTREEYLTTVSDPFEEGNRFPLRSNDTTYRAGVMHVYEWRDPE